MKKLSIFWYCFGMILTVQAQIEQPTTSIKGQIIDKDTKASLPGATVLLIGSNPPVGTVSDMQGRFRLEQIPVGRQGILVSFIGYDPIELPQLNLIAGKEFVVIIELVERVSTLSEIKIVAERDRENAINKMASVSARTFSVEESQRYAGSRNDVSRMATNFAGVQSSNDANNDIVIRGNSSNGLLWRFEGVDIPNPNHFGNLGATGGPVSMLNNNVLANSDFFTGAFPSEYGNATSGVFDLHMRTGNRDKHEFMGQVGFNGFELGAEGPLSKKTGASYLVNYRYSTLGVFKALGVNFGTGAAVPEYDDLTFKLNFPTKKWGNIDLFGLNGRSSIALLGSELDTTKARSFFGEDNLDILNNNRMGVIGISQRYLINSSTYYKLTIAGTYFENSAIVDTVDILTRIPYEFSNQRSASDKLFLSFFIKKKFSANHNVKLGMMASRIGYNLVNRFKNGENSFEYRLNENDFSYLVQPYAQWQWKPTNLLTFNAGIHGMWLAMNNNASIEPRLGARYQLWEKGNLSMGYGLHAQTPDLSIYNLRVPNETGTFVRPNTNLGFQKSQHFVIGYDQQLTADMRLKTELYYQHQFNSIVSERPSAISLLNFGQPPFGYPDSLSFFTNGGTGRNFGIELTLEHFMKDGMYFLTTLSVYDSKYKGSDGVLRNTAFNNRFVFNAVGGKEFELRSKKGKKNYLLIDAKMNWAGGQRYTPIDVSASQLNREEVYDLENSYNSQFKDYIRIDINPGFKSIGKKVTQEWNIMVQNVLNRNNPFFNRFDVLAGEVRTINQLGLFIVPQWRIIF